MTSITIKVTRDSGYNSPCQLFILSVRLYTCQFYRFSRGLLNKYTHTLYKPKTWVTQLYAVSLILLQWLNRIVFQYYHHYHNVSYHALYCHDDVIKWKHFPRNWPFVREIHRSPVNFPHKGQWRGALMFSLIYAWMNDWVNNREAGDLRRQHGHYDVIVMWFTETFWTIPSAQLGRDFVWRNSCHTMTFDTVGKLAFYNFVVFKLKSTRTARKVIVAVHSIFINNTHVASKFKNTVFQNTMLGFKSSMKTYIHSEVV